MLFPRLTSLSILALSLPLFAGSSAPGIENFRQVDEHVYRGAQPSEEGLRYLAKTGVKTIIDLREADGRGRAEEAMVKAVGMTYVNVPMTGLTPPTEREMTQILTILEDQAQGPVFVHCKRGADRTGAVIGAYRIEHSHWDNAHALQEAKANGMGHFQFPRQSFIREFRPRTIEAKSGLPKAAIGTSSNPAIANSELPIEPQPVSAR